MQFISKEDIQKAREMDLLTYLYLFEPGNLKHVSGNTYSTIDHDSLIINNGKWCWFSQGIGGKSALDYLIKVRGLPFRDAVERIIGNVTEPMTQAVVTPISPSKVFLMPEVNSDTSRVIHYLKSRGIDPAIIHWCIEHNLIYETTKYSNVLFVGYDTDGKPRYGAVRSINSDYKGDVSGSDKRFAFKIVRAEQPKMVHVFESAPDLLSYATLIKIGGGNWQKESYLSLAGIGSGKTVPKALSQFLISYPSISHISLHLDNDDPGRTATANIIEALHDDYVVRDRPPPSGKDFNDYLRQEESRRLSRGLRG
ncbi:MAG: DUF3991 and TOPRIM domain-containing protein [Saccharofermentans sp.]|nr:DUF3991 and TOPRIM domain-containing protein [Saccharofermentans sp.]